MKTPCLFNFLSVFTLFLIISFTAQSKESNNLKTTDLLAQLKVGGYIIYLRHGATDHSQNDKDLSDLRECSKQRNLSQLGKSQSRSLGASFKLLNIKLDHILSSPYCRCVDTALYAFDRVVIDQNMRATFATDEENTELLKSHLKKQLSIQPLPGHNTLLVGHTANLREVTKVWPKPEGVMHIFKPLEDNGYKHIGRIQPSEWKNIYLNHKK